MNVRLSAFGKTYGPYDDLPGPGDSEPEEKASYWQTAEGRDEADIINAELNGEQV